MFGLPSTICSARWSACVEGTSFNHSYEYAGWNYLWTVDVRMLLECWAWAFQVLIWWQWCGLITSLRVQLLSCQEDGTEEQKTIFLGNMWSEPGTPPFWLTRMIPCWLTMWERCSPRSESQQMDCYKKVQLSSPCREVNRILAGY